jgi:hypothetical protein
MAFVVADRVQELSLSPGGTGTINLDGGVVPNFKSFATGVGTGNNTYYCILDTTTGQWETGTGTYTTGTPNTLSRATVYANSLGTTALISFTNGDSLNVFCTYPATRGVNADAFGSVYLPNGVLWQYAPAPTSIAAVTTLTAAQLQTGIINTTGTTYTVTLPLATAIDTGFPGINSTNVGFDFYVVNTATGVITMAVNTGITSVGLLTVGIAISAQFRLRRTAANTYILYRVN